jgi:hypothetical protein
MENLKSKYNNETLDICELIGCYFVDTFYNSLYLSAKAEAIRKSTTKTQEYKLSMISYINAINGGREFYAKIVDGLLKWFQVNTQLITCSLEEFENKVIREYVPRMFYDDMSHSEKDKILSSVITTAAQKFASFINKPNTKHLSMIIDGRKDKDNIRYFQKEMLSIMLEQRDIIFGKFIDRNSVKKIDAIFVDKLKDELKKQLGEKLQLKSSLDKAKQVAEQLQKDYNNVKQDLEGQIEALQKSLDEKDNKLTFVQISSDDTIAKLNAEIRRLQSHPTTLNPMSVTAMSTPVMSTHVMSTPVVSTHVVPVSNSSPDSTNLRFNTTETDINTEIEDGLLNSESDSESADESEVRANEAFNKKLSSFNV